MKTRKIKKMRSNEVTCCICGEKIHRSTAHDPYPVRQETWYDDNVRCCTGCNYRFVMPIRITLGRNGGGHHEALKKMDFLGLVKFMHEHRVPSILWKEIREVS